VQGFSSLKRGAHGGESGGGGGRGAGGREGGGGLESQKHYSFSVINVFLAAASIFLA
jgi:hypothetical protein